ncbi:hypothetical protein PGT21_011281 [Puccinia graminis f. sp. tritici]|uniref:Uncharacterized protein n=1 Tax=Puccinia graminis f. sp. tritici TaxID=56615 RepID=A0A5B0PQV4_PUCGR|nr:hypothetical protein PGT21_011281 [Puccinia graminis f. sp. tritici]
MENHPNGNSVDKCQVAESCWCSQSHIKFFPAPAAYIFSKINGVGGMENHPNGNSVDKCQVAESCWCSQSHIKFFPAPAAYIFSKINGVGGLYLFAEENYSTHCQGGLLCGYCLLTGEELSLAITLRFLLTKEPASARGVGTPCNCSPSRNLTQRESCSASM